MNDIEVVNDLAVVNDPAVVFIRYRSCFNSNAWNILINYTIWAGLPWKANAISVGTERVQLITIPSSHLERLNAALGVQGYSIQEVGTKFFSHRSGTAHFPISNVANQLQLPTNTVINTIVTTSNPTHYWCCNFTCGL